MVFWGRLIVATRGWRLGLLLGLGLLVAMPAQGCEVPRDAGAMAAQFLRLANDQRLARGLRPLRSEPRLRRAALGHACDNARRLSYTHRGGDGSTLAQRLRRAGYPYRSAAENTGWGFRTPGVALDWWMHSPPHRANLMNPRLAEIGTALAIGRDGKLYWVIDLGSR